MKLYDELIQREIEILLYKVSIFWRLYFCAYYIFQYIGKGMSPKVVKDTGEGRSNNIKNIYIQKINSLMKISKDTIEKSEIQALNHTNRKKIKKHLSQAQKNTIRLQKNRQSAKKARERKKIYVKLLQQQEKRLNEVLIKTEQVERISSEYVQLLAEKKSEVTTTSEQRSIRKSSDSNIDKPPQPHLPYHPTHKQQSRHKLHQKLILLKHIVDQLTQLSKYAYWKQRKAAQLNEPEQQNTSEEDFFNIEEVLADIEVVHMKNQSSDLNLDDLLNVPFEEDDGDDNDQRENYDIKSLIADQYETVSRCLHELQSINAEAQELLKANVFFKKQQLPPGEDFKNPELAQFKKKNTIVPEYEIKKIKPRRIDSFNSLSSANRSIIGRSRSLFSLNNYFINMEQAETKILIIDRAIEEINRILSFDDTVNKDDREEDFSIDKN